ncbi:hypothetical protein HanPI659440_Chr13g0483581 [Helianthus annuus]|nr:hypothetical protein HanPI659440_Chr13g0483581 [Helianthus annuus]
MANGIRFFELFNKTKIPSVGLGTWQSEPGLVGDAVSAAIKVCRFLCVTCCYILVIDRIKFCMFGLDGSYSCKLVIE